MSESRRRLQSMVQPFTPQENDAAARFRLAAQLMAAGFEMKRMSLKRAYPQESREQITARLTQWAQEQPVPDGFRDASYRFKANP